ncbi:MAG: hypothetical protein ABEL04_11745 [Salinibacter sp.]|uniref:hypothetical protein n=1 Tax=Salinibacter sp. TaxID=2065818 RepID=UPI0035D45CFD
MKRSLVVAVLLLSASLFSCQCAEKPDVGPVEDDGENDQTSQVERQHTPPVG